MEDFDIAELLKTPEGIFALQTTLEGTGIIVDCSKTNVYYLDFGVISTDELPLDTTAVLGYEKIDTENDSKVIEKQFSMKSAVNYSIKKVEVLPSNDSNLPKVLVLVNNIDLIASNIPVKLRPDHPITLKVQIRVHKDYVGFLGRWIIFVFERKFHPNLTSCKIESFVFGLRVIGCVSHSQSVRAKLSSEARVFIPHASIVYFEDPCVQFSFHYLTTRFPALGIAPKMQPPPVFFTLLAEVRNISRPSDEFAISYVKACRFKQLDQFILNCAIANLKIVNVTQAESSGKGSFVMERTIWEPLRNPEAVIRYLQSMGKMLWMEETQMTMDVAQYDMHFVTLTPLVDRNKGQMQSMNTHHDPKEGKVFTCNIVVKGSNESRPKITVGDKIRFRPTKDGISFINSVCPRTIAMFEIEGVIIRYNLQSETVLFELVAPPKEFFWGNQPEPLDCLEIWSKITYQARFTFERSGLVFCHLALAEVLNTPGIRKSLFPADNTLPPTVTAVLSAVTATSAMRIHYPSPYSSKSALAASGDGHLVDYPTTSVTTSGSGFLGSGLLGTTNEYSTGSLFSQGSVSTSFFSQYLDREQGLEFKASDPADPDIPPGLVTPATLRDHTSNNSANPSQTDPLSIDPYKHNDPHLDPYESPSGSRLNDGSAKSSANATESKPFGSGPSTTFNAEQLTAIRAITRLPPQGIHQPLPPLVIFGPPGTGKTSSLIEAIVQLHAVHPRKRVLACAPSDPAADILCQRLKEYYTPSEMIRVNWWQRIQASVPIDIINYCRQTEFGVFEIPSFEETEEFRIIVCTCGTAGALTKLKPSISLSSGKKFDDYNFSTGAGLNAVNQTPKRLAFDLVLIDEASQATEAESFIPLTLCKAEGDGLMVLAGDPQQLGPMTRSSIYSLWGGPVSLQERLLSLPMYNLQKSASHSEPPGQMVIFLTKNYRSHECILRLPSRLFYSGAMEQCGDEAVIRSMVKWKALPQTHEFPLLFVGVDGQHCHELDSPSFFNPEEIDEVVRLCADLIASTDVYVPVTTADIGVICAFRSQVLKMRLAMRERGFGAINVGSVEDFQGQEVKIIIISTVLSARVPAFEMKGALGLIGDRKRFNVAVTRGMALCIVVGQPYLLFSDQCWREFIEYCDENGAYTGFKCDLLKRNESQDDAESDDMQSILNRIAQLSVLGSGLGDELLSKDTTSNYFNRETQWRVML